MWGDLALLIVAKGFKKLLKVQKIAQSGHTVANRGAYHVPCTPLLNKLFEWNEHR